MILQASARAAGPLRPTHRRVLALLDSCPYRQKTQALRGIVLILLPIRGRTGGKRCGSRFAGFSPHSKSLGDRSDCGDNGPPLSGTLIPCRHTGDHRAIGAPYSSHPVIASNSRFSFTPAAHRACPGSVDVGDGSPNLCNIQVPASYVARDSAAFMPLPLRGGDDTNLCPEEPCLFMTSRK